MKHWVFEDSVFEVPIHLVKSSVEQLEKFVKRKFDIDYKTRDSLGKALFNDGPPPVCLIWLCPEFNARKLEWQGVLVHEVSHMTHKVLKELGMTHDESSEEVYAHYSEWMFRQAMKRLKA